MKPSAWDGCRLDTCVLAKLGCEGLREWKGSRRKAGRAAGAGRAGSGGWRQVCEHSGSAPVAPEGVMATSPAVLLLALGHTGKSPARSGDAEMSNRLW